MNNEHNSANNEVDKSHKPEHPVEEKVLIPEPGWLEQNEGLPNSAVIHSPIWRMLYRKRIKSLLLSMVSS